MEIKDYISYADACVFGGKPACTCACPLNLDVRKFVSHVQKGEFSQAYKTYRDASTFPAVAARICPRFCERACVRKEKDDSIRLRDLELAASVLAEETGPARFGMPRRNKTVQIVGAGLAGLTCGVRLAARGYDVTVFEKENIPGGRANTLTDPKIVQDEISLQMSASKCRVEYGREIKTLSELSADAIVLATGCGGLGKKLAENMDRRSYGTAEKGIFLIGAVLGAEPVEDIAQGTVCAISVDKYLKIGLMDGMENSFPQTESCIFKDAAKLPVQPTCVKEGETLSEEKAKDEAARCIMCDCTDCRDACELFDHFAKSPNMIAGEGVASLQGGGFINKQYTTRLISSCTLCGLCGKVCDKDIDIGQMALDFRHFKMDANKYPEGYSEFFLRDMHFSNTVAHLARLAPGTDKADYMFFPGCGLSSADPRYVTRIYAILTAAHPATAIYLGCCGAPADWGAQREENAKAVDAIRAKWEEFGAPTLVLACATCMKQLHKFLPDAKTVSLYELLNDADVPIGKIGGTVNVFDPCASREYPEMQKSVRALAGKADAKIEELPYSGDKAKCCGWGGHVLSANPNFGEKLVQGRIAEGEKPYLTYCTNCRDTFALRGKKCTHILDAVCGIDDTDYTPLTYGEKRLNRLKTKNEILSSVFCEKTDELPKGPVSLNLSISAELREKLIRRFILEEEVCRTIEYLEKTKNSVHNLDTDTYIGYLQIGIITYWVEYRVLGENRYELVNTYSHRVSIDSDTIRG